MSWYKLDAQWNGTCSICNVPFSRGSKIFWDSFTKKTKHDKCNLNSNNVYHGVPDTLKKDLKKKEDERKDLQRKERKQLEEERKEQDIKKIKRDRFLLYLHPHYCGTYYSFSKYGKEYFADELTQDIIKNKKKYGDNQNAKDATIRICQKMYNYIMKTPELQNIDVIIPVPNHPSTFPMNSRAVSISRELSCFTVKPCDLTILTKLIQIPNHRGMGGRARSDFFRKNQVYEISNHSSIQGKKILLIDDVHTTGETINQCVEQLSFGEPAEIHVLCAGKTQK